MIPIRVGLVGTGYAAKLRAECLQQEPQAVLAMVTGRSLERTQVFGQQFNVAVAESWEMLVTAPTIDLVVVSTINREHAPIVRAALEAGKHVVVEYPLALDVAEASELVALAQARDRLLHVEHIELLSGVHQALQAALPAIGTPFYSRYSTLAPKRPAPQKWSYQSELFGFPLVGALSRIHRLTDLFGEVASVSCHARFWHRTQDGETIPPFASCLCSARLRFRRGLIADVIYGKGETLWHKERKLEVHGQAGGLLFDEEQGLLVQEDGSQMLQVPGRRGLFAKDMRMVIEHLIHGTPLYVSPAQSLAALTVADAARRSAQSGETVHLEAPPTPPTAASDTPTTEPPPAAEAPAPEMSTAPPTAEPADASDLPVDPIEPVSENG